MAQMILAKIFDAQVYIGTPKYTECMAKCADVIAGVMF
jgi:hypothetical protein